MTTWRVIMSSISRASIVGKRDSAASGVLAMSGAPFCPA